MEPVVTYLDADGNAVDGPERAASLEVQEFDDQGVPTGRTYLERPAGGSAIAWASTPEEEDIADPDVADGFTKGTWDLYDPQTGEPVTTREQLCRALGTGDDPAAQRGALGDLLGLPSWQAAPDELKTDVRAWLVATRPKTAGT